MRARHAVSAARVDRLTPLDAALTRSARSSSASRSSTPSATRVGRTSGASSDALGALRARRDVALVLRAELHRSARRVRSRGAELRTRRGGGSRRAGQAAGAQRGARRRAEQTREELQQLAAAARRRFKRERRLHDELDRAFSDLRTDLNFQLRPEMSELASAFLSELTDARYTELELDDSTTSSCSRTAFRSP